MFRIVKDRRFIAILVSLLLALNLSGAVFASDEQDLDPGSAPGMTDAGADTVTTGGDDAVTTGGDDAVIPAAEPESTDEPESGENSELIDDLTTAPEAGVPYDGYIVKVKDEEVDAQMIEDAPEEPIMDSMFVVAEPEEALGFAEPEQIEFIEPNLIYSMLDFPDDAAPNDPRFSSQWNLSDQTGIKIQDVWRAGLNGSGARVAVIDSGVNASHQDWAPGTLQTGYNFTGEGGAEIASPPTDGYSHGTKVASIIAARPNNGLDIAGIAYGAEIIPIKVFKDDGTATLANLISALNKAAELNVDVINLSLGAKSSSANLEIAINQFVSQGVIIVAAVGNGTTVDGATSYTALLYPAANDNVIGVASITSARTRSSFSQYNASVDIAAPGSSIYGLSNIGSSGSISGNGTSFAGPHVAALAAIAKGYDPDITPDEFLSLLRSTADPAPDQQAHPDYYGAGIVNARAFAGELTGDSDLIEPNTEPDPVGWQDLPGIGRVYYDGGSEPVHGEKLIDGKWYYFDPDTGALYTGQVKSGTDFYYFDGLNGKLYRGERKVDGKWHYFGTDGKRVGGFQNLPGGKRVYYAGVNGRVHGEMKIGEYQYYFDPSDGAMKTGWISASGKQYYHSEDGKRVYGAKKIGGKDYYFDKTTGAVFKGQVKIGSAYYYFNGKNGKVYKTEKKINKVWYYFGANGKRATGWGTLADGTKKYYHKTKGRLLGEQKVGSYYYYFNTSDGAMKTGWVKIEKQYRYYDKKGHKLFGQKTIGDKKYYFDKETGIVYTGEKTISKKMYFFDGRNGMLKDTTKFYKNYKYVIGKDGVVKSKTYVGDTQRGIDVSEWQGQINWAQVKASGVQFAIIRAGWSDWKVNDSGAYFHRDARFVENVRNAKANGIVVGTYIFVYSRDIDEQRAALASFRTFCIQNGLSFDLPVFLDIEDSKYYLPGTDALGGYSYRTKMLKDGMDLLRSYGYDAGFYTFLNWANNQFDAVGLEAKNNTFWLASWYGNNAELDPATGAWNGRQPGIWQYRSTGSVSGIKGNVDMNYLYPPNMKN
ncbi:MAG: S8 family serine peptidase [Clostridiales Family XIII bacterium]|jgi:subtilisin family serine protease/GH25 family lysozyme M1 (1,4-beta-N-acetylmuramidase)|nr:S8 family serine peptidase [Clostridiales Family XIII bacterium]